MNLILIILTILYVKEFVESTTIQWRMVKGLFVKQHKPYMCSVRYGDEHICGGAILNKKTILTAAHCFDRPIQPEDYSIEAATRTIGQNNGIILNVTRIIVHSGFVPTTLDNDIALMILTTPIVEGSTVSFISLPMPGYEPEINNIADIAGWGDTYENGNGSAVLRELKVPILRKSSPGCSSYGKMVTKNMFCAGSDRADGDPCQGDSGGPLIVNDDWCAIGVVSFGIGCNRRGFATVYTKIANYIYWIMRTTHDLRFGQCGCAKSCKSISYFDRHAARLDRLLSKSKTQ